MTTPLFLTSDELRELTGYQIGHYQARWLDAHGYPFDLTISGKPRVLRSFIEKRLGLASAESLSHTEPDFSFWKQPKAA